MAENFENSETVTANGKTWVDAPVVSEIDGVSPMRGPSEEVHKLRAAPGIVVDHALVERVADAVNANGGRLFEEDEGTKKALQGFREYIDGLSDVEKLEAVGLDVSRYDAIPNTDELQEYKDRLVLEFMIQMLQTVNNVSVDKGITVRQAKSLVISILHDVAEKLTA